MKNFQNHLSQSTNPTDFMMDIGFGRIAESEDSSLTMGFNARGHSMRQDAYIFSIIKGKEPESLIFFDDIYADSLIERLKPADVHHLFLNLINFEHRYPDELEFIVAEELNQCFLQVKSLVKPS